MATSIDSISNQIVDIGVVAVIRLRTAAAVRDVVDALLAGGVRAIEITMTVPGAIGIIEMLAADLPGGAVLGAGTVLDTQTARDVVKAGASFVVSPIFDRQLIDAAHEMGAASLPGCYTPSEIFAATQAGADIVKVFPAGGLGPSFLRDVLAPLPNLRLLPTGGVTLDNAAAWITAGAVAVGIGTALVSKSAVDQGRFDEISRHARTLIESIRTARAASTGVRR
jgi:2-dehydro-3-deoxyphosphogluconate aldolase/(4S)-4-hydroxy-2-oxoglutarate aldolase